MLVRRTQKGATETRSCQEVNGREDSCLVKFEKPALRAQLHSESLHLGLPAFPSHESCPFLFSLGLKESGYIIYKLRAHEKGQEFVSEPCRAPIFQPALHRHGAVQVCVCSGAQLGHVMPWPRGFVPDKNAVRVPRRPPGNPYTKRESPHTPDGSQLEGLQRASSEALSGPDEDAPAQWGTATSPGEPHVRDSGPGCDLIPPCLRGRSFAKLFNRRAGVGKCFSERVRW